jgi:hypothetical protein
MDFQLLLSSIPDFSLAKDRERDMLSRVCTRYRKCVGGLKDIKSDFYINGSSNDDLESEITKDSWRC